MRGGRELASAGEGRGERARRRLGWGGGGAEQRGEGVGVMARDWTRWTLLVAPTARVGAGGGYEDEGSGGRQQAARAGRD